jgi:membrane-associated phospholipid phosphatase
MSKDCYAYKYKSSMLYKLIIFLFFMCSFESCLIAQEVRKDTVPATKLEKKLEKKPYGVSQFAHETFLFVKQPAKWKGNDWLKVGAVVVATVAVMPLDQKINQATQGDQHYYYSIPIVGGRVYGEWYSIGGVTAVFAGYGILTQNSTAKRVAVEVLQAGLYSELVTTVLKVAIGRARPLITDNSYSYRPFTFLDDNYHSMPSGHTTSAVALSTVMSRHADKLIFKILAYVPAAFTMFSRIYQDKHWLSDEIPAAAIGYFTGDWVVNLHEVKKHRININSVYPPVITIDLNKESK